MTTHPITDQTREAADALAKQLSILTTNTLSSMLGHDEIYFMPNDDGPIMLTLITLAAEEYARGFADAKAEAVKVARELEFPWEDHPQVVDHNDWGEPVGMTPVYRTRRFASAKDAAAAIEKMEMKND